uniref:Peptidase A1 domain-containing protein n=1 Tax=Plectus sambesii TaxID=2011161 RepID=A0A914WZ96_9BILA
MIADGTWPAHIKYKESLRLMNSPSIVQQPFNDYDDVVYVANITVGKPQQQFVVILDTGSANFWIPDKTCAGAGRSSDPCARKTKFDSSASTTYKNDGRKWSIYYGSGSANGFLGMDTTCFGGIGTKQLCVVNNTFGQAVHIAPFFEYDAYDGILGMAFQSLAVDHVMPPLIQAISQGLLDQPIFTVWLTHVGLAGNVPGGGRYTYGGLDSDNCGPVIAYVPLSSATYWQFRMGGVSSGSYSSGAGWEVISDTGTSFIGAPLSIVTQLASVVGATFDNQYSSYFINCQASSPDIVFTIGTQQYVVKKENYIIPFGSGRCEFTFFAKTGGGFGPTWILGDTFIRQYCNIHDIGQTRIGFALALH